MSAVDQWKTQRWLRLDVFFRRGVHWNCVERFGKNDEAIRKRQGLEFRPQSILLFPYRCSHVPNSGFGDEKDL